MMKLIYKNRHNLHNIQGPVFIKCCGSPMSRIYLLLMGLWVSEFLLQLVGLVYYLIWTEVSYKLWCLFVLLEYLQITFNQGNRWKVDPNTYFICSLYVFRSTCPKYVLYMYLGPLSICYLVPQVQKNNPDVICHCLSKFFAYIMLWSKFCNLCQYTPLLAAHQELWELVLSWVFTGKISRLRLEMNGRCLKKPCCLRL